MPLKIVRNDITKMNTEAIVNTANAHATVGPGCDMAVYTAAGYEELLRYRAEKIGFVPEGNAFITPGFNLPAEYIIHAVSPFYNDGSHGEEAKLRDCYRKSLQIARENGIKSIAFPLISTGGFGYPKEEGLRLAIDEINAFLMSAEMNVFLVVFDDKATELGRKIFPDLEAYIDRNYVDTAKFEEYRDVYSVEKMASGRPEKNAAFRMERTFLSNAFGGTPKRKKSEPISYDEAEVCCQQAEPRDFFAEEHESKLAERMKHMADTYSEYLMYLIEEKNMENAEVYKRAIVDRKIFSKIKNDANYHPNKLTALCLCIGAKLNLDEAKDLLARAGYALSPCDKTDIIFSYFIENKIYDMIELDIQLEEHGLPCIIT